MPNWCVGDLKVRGTFENLKNFIMNGLQPVDVLGNHLESLTVDECNGYICIDVKETCWIKGTRRNFCEPTYIEFENNGDESIVILPLHAAWDIIAESLQKVCQEFHVDMKIQAFEKGMEFSRCIEIVNGEIIENVDIEYADWYWDCPCPTLGG